MPELFINPLALTELRHGNKGRAGQKGYSERRAQLWVGGREKRAESEREGNGRKGTAKREGEEKTGGREGGRVSFLLLINYFRDKRWPVEKKGANEGGRGIEERRYFSWHWHYRSYPRETPRTNLLGGGWCRGYACKRCAKKRDILLDFEGALRGRRYSERAALRVLRPHDFLWKRALSANKVALFRYGSSSCELLREAKRAAECEKNEVEHIRLRVQDISGSLYIYLQISRPYPE